MPSIFEVASEKKSAAILLQNFCRAALVLFPKLIGTDSESGLNDGATVGVIRHAVFILPLVFFVA